MPAQRKKNSGSTSKDEEVMRKVQELQKKKEELQNKQKEQQSKVGTSLLLLTYSHNGSTSSSRGCSSVPWSIHSDEW